MKRNRKFLSSIHQHEWNESEHTLFLRGDIGTLSLTTIAKDVFRVRCEWSPLPGAQGEKNSTTYANTHMVCGDLQRDLPLVGRRRDDYATAFAPTLPQKGEVRVDFCAQRDVVKLETEVVVCYAALGNADSASAGGGQQKLQLSWKLPEAFHDRDERLEKMVERRKGNWQQMLPGCSAEGYYEIEKQELRDRFLETNVDPNDPAELLVARDLGFGIDFSKSEGPLATPKWHYMERVSDAEQFFGLGDKTGPLNKKGKSFTNDCIDALGYDAEKSDPLYKHYPWHIRPCFGVTSFLKNLALIIWRLS